MIIKPVDSLLDLYGTEDGISLPKHVYCEKNCHFPQVFKSICTTQKLWYYEIILLGMYLGQGSARGEGNPLPEFI